MNSIKNNSTTSKLGIITSMLIFGTIGIFRNAIPLPSGIIAMTRGFIGTFFLISVMLICRKKPNFDTIKKNLIFLITSGALIGFNWILLFEAFNYTSVATATLCYYMAPIFVLLASPIILKEKLTLRKSICMAVAFIGIIPVSGVLENKDIKISEIKGIIFGLGAALLYASVILLNKKITDISSYDKTSVQLFSAGIVLVPYVIFAELNAISQIDIKAVIMLLTIGIIHTGIAYALYFGSMSDVKAQTVAILSYIDPVTAIVLSSIIDRNADVSCIIGAVLILGAAFVCDLPTKNKD